MDSVLLSLISKNEVYILDIKWVRILGVSRFEMEVYLPFWEQKKELLLCISQSNDF